MSMGKSQDFKSLCMQNILGFSAVIFWYIRSFFKHLPGFWRFLLPLMSPSRWSQSETLRVLPALTGRWSVSEPFEAVERQLGISMKLPGFWTRSCWTSSGPSQNKQEKLLIMLSVLLVFLPIADVTLWSCPSGSLAFWTEPRASKSSSSRGLNNNFCCQNLPNGSINKMTKRQRKKCGFRFHINFNIYFNFTKTSDRLESSNMKKEKDESQQSLNIHQISVCASQGTDGLWLWLH